MKDKQNRNKISPEAVSSQIYARFKRKYLTWPCYPLGNQRRWKCRCEMSTKKKKSRGTKHLSPECYIPRGKGGKKGRQCIKCSSRTCSVLSSFRYFFSPLTKFPLLCWWKKEKWPWLRQGKETSSTCTASITYTAWHFFPQEATRDAGEKTTFVASMRSDGLVTSAQESELKDTPPGTFAK